MKAVVLLLSILGAAGSASSASDTSQYVECQNNKECGSGRCCVLVNGHYPTTSCEARRRLGEQCRPPSDYPQSLTLNFPGGESSMLTDVHENLCPCLEGAACSPLGRCVTTTSPTGFKKNNIYKK